MVAVPVVAGPLTCVLVSLLMVGVGAVLFEISLHRVTVGSMLGWSAKVAVLSGA